MRYRELTEAAGRSLHHGTSSTKLTTILVDGIRSPSWWGTKSVANYYSEIVADEYNDEQVIISVPLAQFDVSKLEPDGNSIAEPLTTVLKASEETLYQRWQESKRTWQDSLRIYGSVLYRGAVHITRANVHQLRTRKAVPDWGIVNNYRRMLRLLSWGNTLSADDQRIKQHIETKYDVSGISLD